MIPPHPEMAEVHPDLWIGGWSAARDRGSHFDEIVNVAMDAPTFGQYRFPLVDGPGNDPIQMACAIACVRTLIDQRKRILVHCVSGRSRSATVLAKAMETALGIPFADTIKLIQELRQSPNPEKQPHPALVALVQNP